MSDTQAEKYVRRFARVLDHIESNLDEALNTEQLSRIANFSKSPPLTPPSPTWQDSVACLHPCP